MRIHGREMLSRGVVVSVTERGDGVAVEVAYGTSQRTDSLLSGEFALRKAEHKAAYVTAGLSYDTKFDLRHIVELPWNDEFFAVPAAPQHGQTPKLGSLHIGMTAALVAAVRTVQR